MVECKSTSRMVYQKIREDRCCEAHDSCENNHVPVFNRLSQIFHDFLAFGEANAHKHDGYQPVLLGGGSYMLVRSEPEAIFREGE